jgi:hypothetical protein
LLCGSLRNYLNAKLDVTRVMTTWADRRSLADRKEFGSPILGSRDGRLPEVLVVRWLRRAGEGVERAISIAGR